MSVVSWINAFSITFFFIVSFHESLETLVMSMVDNPYSAMRGMMKKKKKKKKK